MKKLTVEDTSRTKGGMKIKSGLKAGPLVGTISVKVPGLNSIDGGFDLKGVNFKFGDVTF